MAASKLTRILKKSIWPACKRGVIEGAVDIVAISTRLVFFDGLQGRSHRRQRFAAWVAGRRLLIRLPTRPSSQKRRNEEAYNGSIRNSDRQANPSGEGVAKWPENTFVPFGNSIQSKSQANCAA